MPSLLIPVGADQPLNADRCRELGMARVLDPVGATPAQIRAALIQIWQEPAYRRAAQPFKEEFALLPGPGAAVRRLEQLCAQPE